MCLIKKKILFDIEISINKICLNLLDLRILYIYLSGRIFLLIFKVIVTW